MVREQIDIIEGTEGTEDSILIVLFYFFFC